MYTATQDRIAIVGTSPVISALTADIFNTPDAPDTAPAILHTTGLDNTLQLSRPLGPAPSTTRKYLIRLGPPTSSPKKLRTQVLDSRYRLNRPNHQRRQPPEIPCDLLFWVVRRYLLANDPRRTPKHPKTSPRHLIRQSPVTQD
ncbi:hypothetical protein CKAH01_10332 [Colletotrichum kahawae]|uniref:Uncharacterized protein n=1 Tax=Colletotrichum kahawae TaxID=34407 RepID=A0AAD9XW38_COLKA|nr:hypothetical protein CKAH01_10332 [Colletotrichum kahawae]